MLILPAAIVNINYRKKHSKACTDYPHITARCIYRVPTIPTSFQPHPSNNGAEWVLMGAVLLWRFGLAVAWGVVFCEVCNHFGCGCEGGCCGIMVEDGDDCGWWCVLKGVV